MPKGTLTVALDTVRAMLESCTSESPFFPPTLLYNEGWLLRLILNWFSQHDVEGHALSFQKGARWYSEAWLPSTFLARYRGDPLAESWTHADGVVGHFQIGGRGRSDLALLPDADQFVVLEAKLFSGLSKGVTKAPTFDQAARNVACMAEVMRRAARRPSEIRRAGFHVLAPQSQIEQEIFAEEINRDSILEKVARRARAYEGSKDEWFEKWFRPAWERIDVTCLSWEELIAAVEKQDGRAGESLAAFYEYCLAFN